MGAWGNGNFENDDAADWIYDVTESKGVDLLLAPFNDVLAESVYLEAPCCSQALASAEIVSKTLAEEISSLPEEIQHWLTRRKGFFSKPPSIKPEHASLAAQAVTRILLDSELKSLWEEAGELDQWAAKQIVLLEALKEQGK